MNESAIEAKVVKHCHAQGLLCYKFSSPQRRGVPDRLIMGHGMSMFLELKRDGEEPTALQAREIETLNRIGIFATWSDSYEKAVQIIDDFFAHGII